ncbi:helix-turn-helix domain-containing protein [Sphingomonas sp. CFBP 8760]|uniref:helix-turn-helix domain-containing protein n=1 Tax=Sphingomonas sp. CFBP 8760 TaxID=2775282 RepID=UPI00406C360B
MDMPATANLWALTEKEKQTLRLIVRGYDAKSVARSLGLSVHTINERLREARRKMGVSSSREAARLLFETEGDGRSAPIRELSADKEIGEDRGPGPIDQVPAPVDGVGRAYRHSPIIIGVLLMTLALGLLASIMVPNMVLVPASPPAASDEAAHSAVVDAARQWLALLDQGRWDDSYRATGSAFRTLNTAQIWADISRKVRTPLGAVMSRTFFSQENLPAPPAGYEVVKFRTRFANKADAVETVTLDREDDQWRVVGVTIG